jgi:3-oxoadipate enol-lactonase / 4-carboxymuconolactone decarboxylase
VTVGVHHRVDGPDDAPVVVFSTSLGTTHEMWDPQATALAGGYRVLRYDHRGHGRSPVPPDPYTMDELAGDLLSLLDDLRIDRASLVGISLGGAVAMTAALQAPERFERVALCCTAMKFGEPETWHERAAAVRAEGMPAVAGAVLERWLTPNAPAALRERLEAMLLATPPEGYAACCEALAGHDVRGRLGALKMPVLVVAGSDDPSTPPELLEAIADEIPGSRLHRLEGARHLLNLEFADHFDRVLTAFLREGAGMRTRREVLGDAHVDASIERTTPFTADFQDLITRYAWGEIWTRPGLDRRMRSAITLTALVAGGHENELAMHTRAALRNGLSPDEIKEILLQTAIYCGVPAANSAFATAQRVIDEEAK